DPSIVSNSIVNCFIGINSGSGSPQISYNSFIDCTNDAIEFSFTAAPLVQGNIFDGNGGGIDMDESGSPLIVNNLIQHSQGGGITMGNYCEPNIIQNVIIANGG